MNHIKWIFENMKGSKLKFFLGVFILNLICMPCMVIGPIFLSKFVDQVFTDSGIHLNRETMMLLVIYFSLIFIRAVSTFTQSYLINSASMDVIYNLRTKLYRRLSSLTPRFYSKTRTGDIMMRLTGDIDSIHRFVCWDLPHILYVVGIFVAGLLIFYSTNWILATILFITAPFFGGLLMKFRKKAGPYFTSLREANSELNANVQENIAANRVVRAFVREDYEQEKFEKKNQKYKEAAVKASMLWIKFSPFIRIIGDSSCIFVLLAGGILAIHGKVSIGDLALFYNLNWLINDAMNLVGIILNDTQKFFSSTQKIISLYYARTEIQSPEKPVHSKEAESGRIEFCDVSFGYQKKPVLEHVNLTAEPGQTIGIMGPTGSGKSTLGMLLSRFYDVNEGQIKVDGVDVKDYELSELRRKIGMAMQDVFLFSNTIDANIAYGNMDLSEEAVMDFAKMADAHRFITRTSDGYDTIIGERGVGLSGGQKQRIALARALAYESPIVVFDDTTSALDMETEKYIQEQLANRQGKHTTIIVAQRISSVINADKIYILNDRTITEAGTHEELLKKKGYYYDIYCLQQGIKGEGE